MVSWAASGLFQGGANGGRTRHFCIRIPAPNPAPQAQTSAVVTPARGSVFKRDAE